MSNQSALAPDEWTTSGEGKAYSKLGDKKWREAVRDGIIPVAKLGHRTHRARRSDIDAGLIKLTKLSTPTS